MKGVYSAIGALASFIAQAQANSDIISLYTNGATWIQEASATLILPPLPNPVSGDVAIWSAIMMENQASFLQGVTSNSPSGSYCGTSSSWCNFAYTLVGSNPIVGKGITAAPGSSVKTHYKLNPTSQLWDQNVYVNGKLVSSVSTSKYLFSLDQERDLNQRKGKGQHGDIFYVSIECASGNCAAHPAHTWQDISIVLNKADTSFKKSGNWAFGATGGQMSTPDAGKTWNFTTLNIPSQKAE
ncbi:hypothetical protein B9Z65_4027 [Elsinoe australis]|uniref:Uncharacterized protein n=1 Tax=Elsinoe australis TaxID=40998 RepID=A0A2P7Z1N2_9PEZI|nr:hypothetical protein B9Z65_4027 [Elsinoe australis]